MPNAISINPANPIKVGGLGTGVKIFTAPLNSTIAAVLTVPGSNRFEGQQFTILATGSVFVHGTTPTINFVLQSGTSLNSSNNTTIATLTTPQTLVTNTAYPYALKIRMNGDSKSGIVQVIDAEFVCNGVSGTLTTTDLNVLSGSPPVSSLVGEPGLSLVYGIQFSPSDALNAAYLNEFVLPE